MTETQLPDIWTTPEGRAVLRDIEEYVRQSFSGIEGPFRSFDPGKVDYRIQPRTLALAVEYIARYAAQRAGEIGFQEAIKAARDDERQRIMKAIAND